MKESQKYLAVQILKIIGLGAVLTATTILSPTLLYQAVREYAKYKLNQRYSERQVQLAVNYLKRRKFIAYPAKRNDSYFFLTKAGKKRLLQLKIQELEIKKTKWDGKWRIVTFDIPESDTAARFQFRRKLKELGFYHFQRSVFILPYRCENEIKTVSQYLNIQAYVHVLTADRFNNDKDLVKHFVLK